MPLMQLVFHHSIGSDMGLQVLVNVENYEYMKGPHDATGVKILVHGPLDVPMVQDFGDSLPTGYSALVDIKTMKLRKELSRLYCVNHHQCEYQYFESNGPN